MQDWNNDKKRAAELIDLLMDYSTDSETKEAIRAWLWNDVSKDAKDAAMIELFRRMTPDRTPDESDYEKYAELVAMLNIGYATRVPVRNRGRIPFLRTPVGMAAAAVLVLCISGITYLFVNKAGNAVQEPLVAEVKVSAGPSARSVQLPDGSTVELQARSELTYDGNFTFGRQVHLSGEAVLTVVKAANEAGHSTPFSVTTDDLKVDVHGTVFRVTDPSGDAGNHSIVSLYNGSVIVTANGAATMLEQGQEYDYDNITKEFHVALIPAATMAGHGFKPLLRFEESNLGDLVTSLANNYDVEFVLPRDIDLSRGRFSGDFQAEDLKSTLNILTKSSMSLSFTLKDDKVLVARK